MEKVEYAFEIVDKWAKPFENFRRDVNTLPKKIDPFKDMPRSISQLRSNLERYKKLQDSTFRTDHLEKYKKLISETERKIADLEGTTAKTGKTTGDFLKSMVGWGAALGAATMVGRGAYNFGKDSIMAAAQVEKYSVTLKTMLGSKGAARDRMSEYSDIAMKTPFELQQVVEAGNQLQAIGRYSRTNLTQLGDLAAASGKPLDQVLNAYAKISTGQKGEGVNMFRDLLISTDDWVKATGKGISENGELIATTEEMLTALPKIMKAKGFMGMMDEQSRTTEGQISNLKDSMFQLKVAAGERLKPTFDTLLGSTMNMVNGMRKWVEIPTAEKIAREKAELNSLVGIITNANTSEEQRKNLLTQLQQQYPEFLGSLDAETVKNDQLLGKLKEVNAQYDRKAKLESAKSFVNEEENKFQELQHKKDSLIAYKASFEQARGLESYFAGKGVHATLNKQGMIASSFGQNLEEQYGYMQEALLKNPNDKNADEFIKKYLDYKGAISITNKIGSVSNVDQQIKQTEEDLKIQGAVRNVFNKNLTNQQQKDIYQQAKETDITNKSTYEKMFGNKKQADEFNALKQTTFEKLTPENFQRISDFLSGAAKSAEKPKSPFDLEKAQDTISGGGKNVKQIIINLGSIIESNTNVFEPGQNPADDTGFMEKFTNALQSIVNDTNYAN